MVISFLPLTLKNTANAMMVEKVRIAEIADAVSQQLIDMFKDGTLDTIRAKWFANDITLVAQYAN